jgi:hypothetical protein
MGPAALLDEGTVQGAAADQHALRDRGHFRHVQGCPGPATLPPAADTAHEVRLVSRAQSPTEARPWLEDRRRLRVRVKRIMLRGADELREVPVDHPDLTQGWWAVERDGQIMSRWNDGEAVLPLPAMRGTAMLDIHLAGSMTYIVDAVPADGTEQRAAA